MSHEFFSKTCFVFHCSLIVQGSVNQPIDCAILHKEFFLCFFSCCVLYFNVRFINVVLATVQCLLHTLLYNYGTKKKKTVSWILEKLEAIKMLDRGDTTQKVANDYGVRRVTVADWKNKWVEMENVVSLESKKVH